MEDGVMTECPNETELEGPELARKSFRLLMASNPNYFGSFPDLGFAVQEAKAGDKSYEEVDCVSYSPGGDRVEATIRVKRSFGYSGDLCTPGSLEHVRFYVSYGSGWDDVGVAVVNVHDLPVGSDCSGKPTHPLSYVCGVPLLAKRDFCGRPVLPLVRAILSWNFEPPAGQPDWQPVWGNVDECRMQIAPRRFILQDIVAELPKKILDVVPQTVLDEPPAPDPDPEPLQPLSLPAMAEQYKNEKVPAHRFAFEMLTAAAASPVAAFPSLETVALSAQAAGIDLAGVLQELDKTSGDTSYEELECLGLDEGLNGGSLVASFKVKLSSGYSGPPCSAGSTEYVAFWADWEDDCKLDYLGTVKVNVHDYKRIGDGLCYAAVLPVDLGALRQGCKTPVLRRVRAVLSWNTPPSTTNPDAVPVWGNHIDRHVQIKPGVPHDGKARFTIVGGVAAAMVDISTGLTKPGAIVGLTHALPDHCPFAGQVDLFGPNDPALVGHQYRIRATKVGGGSQYLTSPFTAVTYLSIPVTVTPDPITGWTPWPTWMTNTQGALGFLAPGGDAKWVFVLELDTAFNDVATATVQMDNTIKNEALLTDTTNAGDLKLTTAAKCKIPHGPVGGTFVARDLHFHEWSISVIGGPGGPIPPIPLTVGIGSGSETPFGGTPFILDFSDPMIGSCGYVVRLTIYDRAVVDSGPHRHYNVVDRGICLE